MQEAVAVSRLKALIVDDRKLACCVLGRMLERQGFDVELAHSAEQALDAATRAHRAALGGVAGRASGGLPSATQRVAALAVD